MIRRDYIDTRDVAEAIIAVAGSSRGLRVLNVGTGIASSVENIVERLRRILGRAIVIEQDPSRLRKAERMLLAADVEKIRRETNWAPKISLDDTLRDLVALYRLQRNLAMLLLVLLVR